MLDPLAPHLVRPVLVPLPADQHRAGSGPTSTAGLALYDAMGGARSAAAATGT